MTAPPTMLGHLVVDERPGLLPYESASATFSPDRHHRYALTRMWGEAPAAVFVMLNPSTADAFVLDPTVTRCVGYARREGCGGLVVLNAFALRSTDPAALRSRPDPIGPDNDAVIADVLTRRGPVGPVVVAWGVHATLGGRGAAVAAMLRELGVEPLCLGLTKDGHPRHPLYLRRDTALIPYPTTERISEI